MRMLDILYIFSLILLNSNLALSSNPSIKVLGVVEIIRHGARAPLVKYLKTKFIYFGVKRSQLTINGFRQHSLLGRWIRRRYIDGDVYKLFDKDIIKLDPREIKIISTPLQRTILSACAHIQGIFPGSVLRTNYIGRPDVQSNDFPPINHYKPDIRDGKEILLDVIKDELDNLFRVKNCKRKGSSVIIDKEIIKKNLFQITYEQLKLAIKDILKNYGENFKPSLLKLWSEEKYYTDKTLNRLTKFLLPVNYHSGMNLNIKKDTLNTLRRGMLNRHYNTRLEDSISKKLMCSRMFDMILDFFKGKLDGLGKEKLLIFSGHDHNIMNIISNLFSNVFLRQKIYSSLNNTDDYVFLLPPLASSFIIELIQVEGEKNNFVRVIYNGEELKSDFAMNIEYNNKHGLLSYDGFINLLLSRIDFSYKTLDCRQK